MGKGLGFFLWREGKSDAYCHAREKYEKLPTHNVIYSIVQWYLKERHDLSKVPFWAIGDRKTVSL